MTASVSVKENRLNTCSSSLQQDLDISDIGITGGFIWQSAPSLSALV